MGLGTVTQPLIHGVGATVSINFGTWAIAQNVLLSAWIYLVSAALGTWAFAEFSGFLFARWTERTYETVRSDTVQHRIGQLITTRKGVVRAIDDERRRIERDLHDGVQQRVVSLSMLLARARRSPDADKAQDLIAKAHEESQELIEEMRQVAWQIYPAALDELGLERALDMLVQNSPIPVELRVSIEERPPPEVESATYFVAREVVTNAVKHAQATRIDLRIRDEGEDGSRRILFAGEDDGVGGADAEGTGLKGLARRVEALDGTFSVRSPAGGPTTVTAELPHE